MQNVPAILARRHVARFTRHLQELGSQKLPGPWMGRLRVQRPPPWPAWAHGGGLCSRSRGLQPDGADPLRNSCHLLAARL